MAKNVKATKKSDAEKAAKFKELAQKRTIKALKAIAQIGNLSTSNYVRTDEQVKMILEALDDACEAVEKRFAAKGAVAAVFEL